MHAARVIGNVDATVKHDSLHGWRLLIVQPLDINNNPDDLPVLAIDRLGAGRGELVFYTNDVPAVREIVGRGDCPVRFAVAGIVDTG